MYILKQNSALKIHAARDIKMALLYTNFEHKTSKNLKANRTKKVKRTLWEKRNMFSWQNKIMWEKQLVDPLIHYFCLFQPANRCSARRFLVKIYFLMLKQLFYHERNKINSLSFKKETACPAMYSCQVNSAAWCVDGIKCMYCKNDRN